MPRHNPEKPFGDSFCADNERQAGVISLFVEFSISDPSLSGEQLLEGIRDAMSATQLVHPDIASKLPIYQKIKSFLERYDIEVPITEESGNLIARRLIYRIWGDDEYERDRTQALQAFDDYRNGALIPSQGGSSSVMQDIFGSPRNDKRQESGERSDRNQTTSRSLASAVAKRFQHDSSKFSGKMEESWDKYLDSYIRAAKEMELSTDQKIKFFHHVLRDHALGFYRDFIEDKVNNWGEILRLMSDEFNSAVKMESIADRLRNIHISNYETKECSEAEALRAMANDIQLLTPQAPKECRTDRYRRMVLQDGTRGRNWALQVVSSSHARTLSYQKLLHELENALQQYSAHHRFESGPSSSSDSYYRTSRIADTNFAGQARYGRDPKSRNVSKRPPTSSDLQRCWNCEKSGCSVGKCTSPRNLDRIRKNRIKYFEARKGVRFDKHTQDTLLEFSFLLDEEADVPSSDSEDENQQNDEIDKAAGIQHSLIHTRVNHGLKQVANGFDADTDEGF